MLKAQSVRRVVIFASLLASLHGAGSAKAADIQPTNRRKT